QMPAIGLGVFQSPPEQTAGAVESALTQGYRLVNSDTVHVQPRLERRRGPRSGQIEAFHEDADRVFATKPCGELLQEVRPPRDQNEIRMSLGQKRSEFHSETA